MEKLLITSIETIQQNSKFPEKFRCKQKNWSIIYYTVLNMPIILFIFANVYDGISIPYDGISWDSRMNRLKLDDSAFSQEGRLNSELYHISGVRT